MFSLDQYTSARTSAIVIDRSTRGKIALTGSDRTSFLHALLTNDIARLTKGTGTYAAYLTPQGRMISDMRVIETGDRIVLDVERSVAGSLAERFDKLVFSEDVQVQDLTDALAEFGVHGPAAPRVVELATGADTSSLENQYDNTTIAEGGPAISGPLTVVRDDSLGLTGFDVYVPRRHASELRAKFLGASAVEATDETAEVLRIEAGRPRFEADMDTDTIPLEAGIEDRAISFTKGCYVGQEVIIRVMHRGHGRVARRLVGLQLSGSAVPARGDAISNGEERIGEITSAAGSPLIGGPIALGYVKRAFSEPGTHLRVGQSAARVHALPFRRD
jgi:folate-binding protein YgfZ